MSSLSCVAKIAADLNALGVLPGDTVLVHSSYKSLGPVAGGIETVVRGFLEALGKEGTLLVPTLSWALRPPEVFDVRTTPVNIGAIPEYFRNRAGTSRSLHPTHSVCGIGRCTDEFLGDHALDFTPCGPHSPFNKLTRLGGKIVMLGCSLRPNTTMHAIEETVSAPYVFGSNYLFTIRDGQGRSYRREYRTHGFGNSGYIQRYDRVETLQHDDFMQHGRVLAAETFVLEAAGLRKAVTQKMREDRYYFVD